MKEGYKIQVSTTGEINWSPWCSEKARTVVQGLAHLVDLFESRPDIPSDVREQFLNDTPWMLANATKLLSFGCGAEWTGQDGDLIAEGGYEGYETVAVRYGLLRETTHNGRIRKISEFIDRVSVLLDGPRAPNRTFLHDVLRDCMLKHPTIDRIATLLDQVTMGELSWGEFVPLARTNLDELARSQN